VTPSKDAAIVRFRQMLDVDMNAIYGAYVPAPPSCSRRDQCIGRALKMEKATQSLIDDLASTPAPAPIQSQAAEVDITARRLLDEVTAAVDAMEVPSSDFSAIYYAITTDALDFAVGVVDCWPARPYVWPLNVEGYACTPPPSPGDAIGHV
jgi:hypothetical protein